MSRTYGSAYTCRNWCRGAVLVAAITAVLLPGLMSAAALAREPGKVVKRRHHVEKRARKQRGAPYVYGGSSPAGFDCSGFTRWVFAGHSVASLPHSAAGQFALGRVGAFKHLWNRDKLHTGDLIFFKTTSAPVGHAGIYVGGGRFIHASTSSGVRVDSVWDQYYWGPRWVGATRVPALQHAKGA